MQGLGFVEYLVRNYHEFRLLLLLEAITSEGSVSRAFEVTYGKRLDELEVAWWRQVTAAPSEN